MALVFNRNFFCFFALVKEFSLPLSLVSRTNKQFSACDIFVSVNISVDVLYIFIDEFCFITSCFYESSIIEFVIINTCNILLLLCELAIVLCHLIFLSLVQVKIQYIFFNSLIIRH